MKNIPLHRVALIRPFAEFLGDVGQALFYAEKMFELVPDNPQVQEYIKTLQQELNSR